MRKGTATFKPISTRIKEKRNAIFGEILRRPENDPVRETILKGEMWNLPEIQRVGRPRVNWIIETAKNVWAERELFHSLKGRAKCEFDPKNQIHIETIVSAADLNIF